MKTFIFFSILAFGFTALVFAQQGNSKKPNLPKGWNGKLQEIYSFKHGEFNFGVPDSTWTLNPEILFQEKPLTGYSFSPKKSLPGITPLPNPQSRMPIKFFDDSVNYTILRKEYD